MKNLDFISEELFNKIRGRFPSVTIGNAEGVVTNVPSEARFFDFDFKEGDKNLGKVSVSVDDKSLSVMYSNNFVEGQDAFTKEKWYGFLKELRYFAKKRLLNFDTRNITKSNLNRRDYKFLAKTSGEQTMSESKMYGTSKTSYQDVGTARLALKHSKPVNQELAHGRTQHVEAIYIESDNGERFRYPYRHLNGARAMARHVSEGGNAYDDFGKYIVGLSEELNKLRKFKNYMGRSSVMAEGLQGYMDVVHERIDTVKKTIEQLQKTSHYKTAFENFETPVFEDVPDEVASNWIDQLTIRQFNEELKDVFPYIYKLVNEKTKAKELGPKDILGERTEDDLMTAYERGGESQLARALGITTDQLDDEINEVGYNRGLHADDDREDIILDIIRDHADDNDLSMSDYDGQPSSYDEYQDLSGGDDWDHGQYDFDGFESWANDVVENGLEDGTNEASNDKKDALQDWYDKYNKYKGNNGDDLADGFFDAYLDTGILTDATETNEFAKAVDDVFDGDRTKAEEELFGNEEMMKKHLPITHAMHEEFEKIMGAPVGATSPEDMEDNVHKAAKILGDEVVGFSLDEADDDKKEQIKAWANKYKKYEGDNGDPLPAGFLEEHLNTGVPTDSIEAGEVKKYADKYGDDALSDLSHEQVHDNPDEFPITNAFLKDLEKIFGYIPHGDEVEEIADILKYYDEPKGIKERMLKAGGLCPSCKGSGRDERTGRRCSECMGTGKLPGIGENFDEDKPQVPVTEFVLSLFDRQTGQFPKGETAVLTAVEKDYGERYINGAKEFIEAIKHKFEEHSMRQEASAEHDAELAHMRQLAGLTN